MPSNDARPKGLIALFKEGLRRASRTAPRGVLYGKREPEDFTVEGRGCLTDAFDNYGERVTRPLEDVTAK